MGNEPDHFAGGSRPSGWGSADYTKQFLVRKALYADSNTDLSKNKLQNWTSILTKRLSLPPRIFQAGAFADDPTPSASMTTVDIINEGVDSTGVIKLFDQHTSVSPQHNVHLINSLHSYQYSTFDPVRNAKATLPNLVNHQNITACDSMFYRKGNLADCSEGIP